MLRVSDCVRVCVRVKAAVAMSVAARLQLWLGPGIIRDNKVTNKAEEGQAEG